MRQLYLYAASAAALAVVVADIRPATAQVVRTSGYYAAPMYYRNPVNTGGVVIQSPFPTYSRGPVSGITVQPFATQTGNGIPGTYGWSAPGTYGWGSNTPIYSNYGGYGGYRTYGGGMARGWRRW